MHYAGEKILAKARTLAAHQLECSEDDLEFAGGDFTVAGTDRSANIKALAFAAWTAHDLPDGMEPGLTATAPLRPAELHVAERRPRVRGRGRHGHRQRRDPARTSPWTTAACGINPLVVEGQVHGGVAQGIAEALFEEAGYDEEGNLLHGTMTHLHGPRAAGAPDASSSTTPSRRAPRTRWG